MATRRLAPVLFLVASGLWFAAAIVALLAPASISRPTGRPLLSASLGVVFLIVGLAARRRHNP